MIRARTVERSAHQGGSHIQTSENLFDETALAQQMKEDVEQTPEEQRLWRKPRRTWEISQGKKTKAAKFKRERKAVSAGPAASINTWMAASSRKKGGIIPCLIRCRTRPEATRKPGRRQPAGREGIKRFLCLGRNWAVSKDAGS